MRVGMMMRDTEYRDAMIEMMSGYDKDIFIEIAGPSGVGREAVILTDIMPEEIEQGSLEKIRKRSVFLSPVPVKGKRNDCSEYHIMFKYCSLAAIMAELSLVYSAWSGDTGNISPSTRIIAVTGDSDQLSGDRCRSLAGQILYRHGGRVLILPLGYVNDHRDESGADDRGWFRRLMYMIDEGRDYLPESFTYTDSYGISYLRLPDGINPLTALGSDYTGRLIRSIGSHFDTVILDIGSCYSPVNRKLIAGSDNILFFGGSRRMPDIGKFIGNEHAERTRKIGITDPGAEALGIDDFVTDTFGSGAGDGKTGQKRDDTQIQR